jgi:epoxyqueuosine reductase QueG
MKDLTAGFKDYIVQLGGDLVGVASAESMMRAPEGHRPTDFLANAQSVLIWATRLIDGVVEQMPESRREFTANNFEAETVNQEICFKAAKFLEKEGFRSFPISYFRREYTGLALYDPLKLFGSVSCKHAGEEAGIGQIGIHSLLITPEFGPRHRLAAVITEAPLQNGQRQAMKLCDPEKCGYRCVEACPIGAIHREGYDKFDKYRCSEYGIRVMGNFRCSMCMAVCPSEIWGT